MKILGGEDQDDGRGRNEGGRWEKGCTSYGGPTGLRRTVVGRSVSDGLTVKLDKLPIDGDKENGVARPQGARRDIEEKVSPLHFSVTLPSSTYLTPYLHSVYMSSTA